MVSNPADTAASAVLGIILLLAITIILAILVLLLCQMPQIFLEKEEIPVIFSITKIRHTDEQGRLNYDSYMVVKNSGAISYARRSLSARTYRNGALLMCEIPTLNGEDFIRKSHHYDVQYISGADGDTWHPGAAIAIDYQDRTFYPGDIVTFDVLDSTTQRVLSSHSVKA